MGTYRPVWHNGQVYYMESGDGGGEGDGVSLSRSSGMVALNPEKRQLKQCYILALDYDEGEGVNPLYFERMPESIEDSVSAEYDDVSILGRSSPHKAYSGTSGRSISLELQFIASMYAGDGGGKDAYRLLERKLRFLRSLAYPSYTQVVRPPTRCLVRVGEWLAFECVCSSVSITRNKPWGIDGMYGTYADVSLQFDEVSDVPFSREEVMAGGRR